MSTYINNIQISKTHDTLWCDGDTAQSEKQVDTRSGKLLQNFASDEWVALYLGYW